MANDPLHRSNTIVVADDSLAQRKLLQSMLGTEGFEVVLCTDGREALEYLRRYTPALLLLDVNMPHVDGPSVCDRAKRVPRLRHVPVVLLTSHADDRHRAVGEFVRADAYLVKPSSRDEIVSTVRRLLAAEQERAASAPPQPASRPASGPVPGSDELSPEHLGTLLL